MGEDIKWKAFFMQRVALKKGKNKMYIESFGFLSDILYDLLFCLIIVRVWRKFVDPFLSKIWSGETAEECGDATGL